MHLQEVPAADRLKLHARVRAGAAAISVDKLLEMETWDTSYRDANVPAWLKTLYSG
jgi:hypothetical protein